MTLEIDSLVRGHTRAELARKVADLRRKVRQLEDRLRFANRQLDAVLEDAMWARRALKDREQRMAQQAERDQPR